MPLAEFHDDVEEVHRIELQLVAKADVGLQIAQILIRRDVGDDFSDQLPAFFFRHVEGCGVSPGSGG